MWQGSSLLLKVGGRTRSKLFSWYIFYFVAPECWGALGRSGSAPCTSRHAHPMGIRIRERGAVCGRGPGLRSHPISRKFCGARLFIGSLYKSLLCNSTIGCVSSGSSPFVFLLVVSLVPPPFKSVCNAGPLAILPPLPSE